MTNLNATRIAPATLGDRITALAGAVKMSLRRRAIYHRTLRELEALTDRDLADLGVSRGMIHRIADDAARAV